MVDRKKSFSLRIAVLVMAASIPVLVACGPVANFKLVTAGVSAAANGFFKRTDVNLLEKNHAAADYMAVPMKEFVDRTDLIIMHPLTETDNGVISSPLGMKIPEDIGLRLTHLGFKVALHEVAAGANTGLYIAPKDAPRFIFGGHYLRDRDTVNISLRITDAKSGQVVSAFDYELPVTREIENLSNTPTRIFKVEPDY